MKKIILGSIFLLLLMGSASALSATIKESYQPRETIIFEIQGNLLEPIKADNVEWKRGNVRIPLEFEAKKLGDKTFIWAIAPDNVGRYTLILHKISTIVEGINREVEFEKNFSVLNNSVSYNIKPGVILALEDFSLKAFLFEDNPKEVKVDFGSAEELELKPGENNFNFKIGVFDKSGLVNLQFGEYNIPVYIIKKTQNTGVWSSGIIIEIIPFRIQRVLPIGAKNLVYPIVIKNTGEKNAELVEIWTDNLALNVSVSEIKNFSIGSEIEMNLSVREALKKEIAGNVYIESGGEVNILQVKIEIDSGMNSSYAETTKGFYCTEIREGRLCGAAGICKGEIKSSLDGSCCVGECKINNSENSGVGWIGWLLLGIVILAAVIIFIKYRKAKPSVSGLAKAMGKN